MKKLLAYLLGFMVSARPFPLNLDERTDTVRVFAFFTFLYKIKVAPFLGIPYYLSRRAAMTNYTAGSLPPRSLKIGYILKSIGGKLINYIRNRRYETNAFNNW